jgi:hypothetical protein
MVRAVAIQAVGYLALLALVYGWFGIVESNAWQLMLSVLLGLVILFVAVWLIASALAAPELVSLRRLGGCLVWFGAVAAVIFLCVWLAGYRPRVGLSVASHLTLWFRRPVKPQTVGTIYVRLLRIAGTAGVLVILPFTVKARPTRRYWMRSAPTAAAGFLLSMRLISWVPAFQSFGAQTASMIVRFGLAYAIALAAWLVIASAARRSRSAATA